MQRVFLPGAPFRGRDGTLLSPFLNPWDTTSGLPADLLALVSAAAGILLPGQPSKIHTIPFATQVILMRWGWLCLLLRKAGQAGPQEHTCGPDSTVVTPAGSWLRLEALGTSPGEISYVVTPACVYELGPDGSVLYDDSVVIDEDWAGLALADWKHGPAREGFADLSQREAAVQLLRGRRLPEAADQAGQGLDQPAHGPSPAGTGDDTLRQVGRGEGPAP